MADTGIYFENFYFVFISLVTILKNYFFFSYPPLNRLFVKFVYPAIIVGGLFDHDTSYNEARIRKEKNTPFSVIESFNPPPSPSSC